MTERAALRILDDTTPPGPLASEACVLVIGNFDGVHRGHQAVLAEAVNAARAQGLVPSVLTFDPHPAAVVGSGAPPLLTTLERRAELMGVLGVERVYARRFDAALLGLGAGAVRARARVRAAARARGRGRGRTSASGASGRGTSRSCARRARSSGFEVRVHGIASDEKGPFSSTRAREAIAAGALDEAERVLGRPHALSGVVVHGEERGRTIQVPTANIAPVAEMLPPDGVYAVRVDLFDEEGGAAPLGRRRDEHRHAADGRRRGAHGGDVHPRVRGRPLRRAAPGAPRGAAARRAEVRQPRRAEGADRAGHRAGAEDAGAAA